MWIKCSKKYEVLSRVEAEKGMRHFISLPLYMLSLEVLVFWKLLKCYPCKDASKQYVERV